MRSIKDFTDVELDKQIEDARIDLDQSEYGTGDYNHAEAELAVAEKEKQRRGREEGYNMQDKQKSIKKMSSEEILRQQLELLAERSKRCDDELLASMSHAMFQVVTAINLLLN